MIFIDFIIYWNKKFDYKILKSILKIWFKSLVKTNAKCTLTYWKCNIKGFLERKPFGHLSAEPACLGAAEISEIERSG